MKKALFPIAIFAVVAFGLFQGVSGAPAKGPYTVPSATFEFGGLDISLASLKGEVVVFYFSTGDMSGDSLKALASAIKSNASIPMRAFVVGGKESPLASNPAFMCVEDTTGIKTAFSGNDNEVVVIDKKGKIAYKGEVGADIEEKLKSAASDGAESLGDAPAVTIKIGKGNLKTSDFKGRVTLVVFGTVGSAETKKGFETLSSHLRYFAGSAISAYHVNFYQLSATTSEYFKSSPPVMAYMDDTKGSFLSKFDVSRLPVVYVVDKFGMVRYIGLPTADDLRSTIEALLAEEKTGSSFHADPGPEFEIGKCVAPEEFMQFRKKETVNLYQLFGPKIPGTTNRAEYVFIIFSQLDCPGCDEVIKDLADKDVKTLISNNVFSLYIQHEKGPSIDATRRYYGNVLANRNMVPGLFADNFERIDKSYKLPNVKPYMILVNKYGELIGKELNNSAEAMVILKDKAGFKITSEIETRAKIKPNC